MIKLIKVRQKPIEASAYKFLGSESKEDIKFLFSRFFTDIAQLNHPDGSHENALVIIDPSNNHQMVARIGQYVVVSNESVQIIDEAYFMTHWDKHSDEYVEYNDMNTYVPPETLSSSMSGSEENASQSVYE